MKKIFGLAGMISSGKGTVGDYIKNTYQGEVFVFSDILRDILKRTYQEINRENMQKMSTVLREGFHDNLLSEVISHDVEKSRSEIVAVDGVRRWADIEYLNKLDGFNLIYLETEMKLRFERLIKRGQNIDDEKKTFEEFEKDNQREAERQIAGLKEKADFVVDNNGTFEELYRQIDEIVKK